MMFSKNKSIKKILVLFLSLVLMVSCFVGCGMVKNPRFLEVEINGKEYETGIKLSDMLKHLSVKTEPDILTLNKNQFTKLRLEDKDFNSYYIGIRNTTDAPLDYKECEVVYFKTISVSMEELDSISFGKYDHETSYDKIVKLLGDPDMDVEDGNKKIYVWYGEDDSAACIVFNTKHEYILETVHGLKEYVLDAANIQLINDEEDNDNNVSYFDNDFLFEVDGTECAFNTRPITVADKFDIDFLSLEKDIAPESVKEVIAANNDFVFILGLYNDTGSTIKAKEGRFAYIRVTTPEGYKTLNKDMDYVLHKHPQATTMTGVDFKNLKLDMSIEDMRVIMSGRDEIKLHSDNTEFKKYAWDDAKTRFIATYDNDGKLLEFEYGLKGVSFRDSKTIEKGSDIVISLSGVDFRFGDQADGYFKKGITEENFEAPSTGLRGKYVASGETNDLRICFVKGDTCVNEVIIEVENNTEESITGQHCNVSAVKIPVQKLSQIGKNTILMRHDICIDDGCDEEAIVYNIDMNYGKHVDHKTESDNGQQYSIYTWDFKTYTLTLKFSVNGSSSELDMIIYSIAKEDQTVEDVVPDETIEEIDESTEFDQPEDENSTEDSNTENID